MPLIDIAALLRPVDDTAPCGTDPVHDDAYLALMSAARGKPDQQFGKMVVAATEPNWIDVQRLATELLARSKDLRVAMQLLRAWTHRHGLAGLASGLQLVLRLLERHWDTLHPLLDAEDHDDPTQRINAFTALSDGTAVPLDVRAATLDGARLGLTGRELELAAGRQPPNKGESKPTPEGLRQALLDAEQREPGLLRHLQAGHAALSGIEALLNARVGSAAPHLQPLLRFTRLMADSAAAALGTGTLPSGPDDVAGHKATTAGTTAATTATATPTDGAIHSREDAMRDLQRVCDWIEQNEPGHPAPILIQRARRLMAKNFMDIIKDIFPEGVAQVQKLAGVTDTK